MRLSPTLALALLLPPAAARAQDAALQQERLAYGRAVAINWCANCHVVGPAQASAPGDAAPPFAAIARMPAVTEMSLRAFLRMPHADMPDYRLSQPELDGVVAYILSLR
ncbi:c-type cytochrome [Siccirubricoccus phaeus]|uniref:c-type cytochrome n=1 Tax=Siccirubricoccus phaeus TaxID=2595053 RepID=UPI0011F26879|nr:cytochrome c [Siccirubricoccus phaeus]